MTFTEKILNGKLHFLCTDRGGGFRYDNGCACITIAIQRQKHERLFTTEQDQLVYLTNIRVRIQIRITQSKPTKRQKVVDETETKIM